MRGKRFFLLWSIGLALAIASTPRCRFERTFPAAVILIVTARPTTFGQSNIGRIPLTAPCAPTASSASERLVVDNRSKRLR